jgi:hypothetical protein
MRLEKSTKCQVLFKKCPANINSYQDLFELLYPHCIDMSIVINRFVYYIPIKKILLQYTMLLGSHGAHPFKGSTREAKEIWGINGLELKNKRILLV